MAVGYNVQLGIIQDDNARRLIKAIMFDLERNTSSKLVLIRFTIGKYNRIKFTIRTIAKSKSRSRSRHKKEQSNEVETHNRIYNA